VNETLRDRIKRRVRWAAAASIAGGILLVAFAIVYHDDPKSFPNVILYIGVPLVLGGVLVIQTTRCRKCGGNLRMHAGLPWIGIPNFCPHCGTNLDEPST
jgi:hypothetical protein